MSDNYCARQEALLLLALRLTIGPNADSGCQIISIDTSNIGIDPTQMLYVESDFDNEVNWEINEQFRDIITEVRLAGFDFVYLPKIAEHYRSISNADFLKMVSFLYSMASIERIESVTSHLRGVSTSEFCKD